MLRKEIVSTQMHPIKIQEDSKRAHASFSISELVQQKLVQVLFHVCLCIIMAALFLIAVEVCLTQNFVL